MSESFPTDAAENRMVEPSMEAAGIEPARHSPRATTSLYFIRVAADGPIKIGLARDVTQRLAHLQTGNHEELFVFAEYLIPKHLALEIEDLIHTPRPSTGSLPGARSARTTPAQARKQHSTPSPALEESPTTIGAKHPCPSPHSDGLDSRPHVRAGRQVGTSSLVGPALDTGRLVRRRVVHPLTRGRVEREHRERLLRRHAVPSLDVAVGWRAVVAASGVAAGAAVQVVSGVAARRRLLVGMGHGACLRLEVVA